MNFKPRPIGTGSVQNMAAFFSALVLTYQSTAKVYLGPWFQKSNCQEENLVYELLKGQGPQSGLTPVLLGQFPKFTLLSK